jgi:type II secretory pathway pseudopilin PulG
MKRNSVFRAWVRDQAGLTFWEWVIFATVVGILAALAYPHIQLLQEKWRENLTRNNIRVLQSAIEIYYADHNGIWPSTLDPSDTTTGWGFGSYLRELPAVLATHPLDPEKSPAGNAVTYARFEDPPALSQPEVLGKGWRYDGPGQGNTGCIWVNSTYRDTRGIPYSTYGY